MSQLDLFTPFVPFRVGEKWGYAERKSMKIVIQPIYDMVDPFEGEVATVGMNNQWGLIDVNGNAITPFCFDKIHLFSEQFASVWKDDKWGYINKLGNTAIDFVHDFTSNFLDGYAVVGKLIGVDEWSKTYGVIDQKGNEILPLIFDEMQNCGAGLFKASKEGQFGFVNHRNQELLPFKYSRMEYMNGHIVAAIGSECFVFDSIGELIFQDGKYDNIYPRNDGSFCVAKGNKQGVVDIDGRTILARKYDLIFDYSEGLSAIKLNGKWGYFDKKYNLVISHQYTRACMFSEGLAAVCKEYNWGFIDKEGFPKIPYLYDLDAEFEDGIAFVSRKRVAAPFYIDREGREYFSK